MGKDKKEVPIIIHPPSPLPLEKEGGIFTRGIWRIGNFIWKRQVAGMIKEDAASLTPVGGKGV